jgi:hypothetical protein
MHAMMKTLPHASRHMLAIELNFRLLLRLQIAQSTRPCPELLTRYRQLFSSFIGQMPYDASMRIRLSCLLVPYYFPNL